MKNQTRHAREAPACLSGTENGLLLYGTPLRGCAVQKTGSFCTGGGQKRCDWGGAKTLRVPSGTFGGVLFYLPKMLRNLSSCIML